MISTPSPNTTQSRLIACALLFLSLCAIQAATPSETHAQTRSERRQAQRLVREGQSNFQKGRFREAGVLFLQAFQLDPHPIIMYNVARAHEESGSLIKALEYYRTAIGLKPSEAVRSEISYKIEDIEIYLRAEGVDVLNLETAQWVPRGQIRIDSEPTGAIVFINGQKAGKTPLSERTLPQGDYTIRLEKYRYQTTTSKVTIIAGKTTNIRSPLALEDTGPVIPPGTLELTTPRRGLVVFVNGNPLGISPLGSAQLPPGDYTLSVEGDEYPTFESSFSLKSGETVRLSAPNPALDVAPPPEPVFTTRDIAWISIGTSGALLIAGSIFGSLALNDAAVYEDNPQARGRAQLRDDAHSNALTADILFGVGAAAAITGGVLLWMTLDDSEESYNDTLVQRPSWHITPTAHPQGAGILGSFAW